MRQLNPEGIGLNRQFLPPSFGMGMLIPPIHPATVSAPLDPVSQEEAILGEDELSPARDWG